MADERKTEMNLALVREVNPGTYFVGDRQVYVGYPIGLRIIHIDAKASGKLPSPVQIIKTEAPKFMTQIASDFPSRYEMINGVLILATEKRESTREPVSRDDYITREGGVIQLIPCRYVDATADNHKRLEDAFGKSF